MGYSLGIAHMISIMNKTQLMALLASLAEDPERDIETLSIVATKREQWVVSLIIQ